MLLEYCLMPSLDSKILLNGIETGNVEKEEDLLEIFKKQNELRKEKYPDAIFNFRLLYFDKNDKDRAESWTKKVLEEKNTHGNTVYAFAAIN